MSAKRKVELAQETKSRIRQETLDRSDRLPPDQRKAASAAIRARLAALDAVGRARTLLGFAPLPREVQLDPLLTDAIERGVAVYLPYIERFSPPDLQIARVADLSRDLVPARLGIREPDPSRRRPARIDRLDLVIVPGVAFDPAGRRLGHGAGFYDRLLSRLRPGTPVVAVAFDTQVVGVLPEEPHDMRVDVIVTESRTIRAAGPRDGFAGGATTRGSSAE